MNVNPSDLYWIPGMMLLMACFSLIRLVSRGRLLTMVGGLHTNIALLLGVGPIAYLNYFVNNSEKFSVLEPRAIDQIEQFGPYLVGSYIIWIVIDLLVIRDSTRIDITTVANRISPTFLICFMGLSLLGYFLSGFEFSTSGVGTIFPVLKNYMYPVLLVSISKVRSHSLESLILAFGLILLTGFLSFYSAWRSELIIYLVTVTLGIMIRIPKFTPFLVFFVLVGCFLLFPFLQYKKNYYLKFQADPFNAFLESQNIDFDERQNVFFQFFSTRINGMREMGYVDRAVKENIIGYRDGGTYTDAMLQLVPRVIWPDKPEFNKLVNAWLPRQIGLVDRNDQGTSWGVNVYAEFLWNFPAPYLLVLTPILFLLCTVIDRQTSHIFKTESTYLIASTTLFFTSLSLVGMVVTTTYVVWNIIIMKVVDNHDYSGIRKYSA
jgi:hypothetical protein